MSPPTPRPLGGRPRPGAETGTGCDNLPVCDLAKLREKTLGDPAFLAELAATFEEDRPGHFENIRRAIRESDSEALVESAHALLGSLRVLEAPCASRLAGRLERLGEMGDFEAARRLVDSLDGEAQRLAVFLAEAAERGA